MTFEQFIKQLRHDVDNFEKNYKEGMKLDIENDSDIWPSEQPEGDWYEQFFSWEES